jgi:hypothetical protein
LEGFGHRSKAVQIVSAVNGLSALGLGLLSWAANRPEFPGLHHAAPLAPWMFGIGCLCALASVVAWHKHPPLVVAPIAASSASALASVFAHFPLFAPLLWGNLAAIALAIWWVSSGQHAKRDDESLGSRRR